MLKITRKKWKPHFGCQVLGSPLCPEELVLAKAIHRKKWHSMLDGQPGEKRSNSRGSENVNAPNAPAWWIRDLQGSKVSAGNWEIPSQLKCSQDISKNESDFAQSRLTLHCTFLSSVSTCSWRPPGWTWHDVAMTWRRGGVGDSELQAATVAPACSKLLKVLKDQGHW